MERELLSQYAHYNRLVNADLTKLLTPLMPEKWTAPAGSYFKSAGGILAHLVQADLGYLRRYRDWGVMSPALSTRLGAYDAFQMPGSATPDWLAYQKIRPELDAIMEAFVAELDDETRRRKFEFKNIKGKLIRMSVQDVFIHLANHSTHHRGALSQLLDEWGIDNDFSGFNRVTAEWLD